MSDCENEEERPRYFSKPIFKYNLIPLFNSLHDIKQFVLPSPRKEENIEIKNNNNNNNINNNIHISKKEWKEYQFWIKQVIKTSLYENESFESPLSIRFLLFLHFYRLEIPTYEITPSNIIADYDCSLRSRIIFQNVVSYIMVPLDQKFSYHWWCSPSPSIPPFENGFSFVLHKRQTFPDDRSLV